MKGKQKSKYNAVPIGVITGIVAPMLAMFIFYLYEQDQFETFRMFYKFLISQDVLTNVISLCAIPNLLFFYIYLRRNYYYSARGVILATFIIAFAVFVMKIS
jgi:hypothetical protein